MARLGATAAPMPLNEVLAALQRNVIDGTRSALSIYVTLKYQDVSKVVTVTHDTMLVPVATVSKPWLDKLPADLQTAVREAGEAAQKKTDAFTGEFMAGMPKRWAEVGGEVYVMPEAERGEARRRAQDGRRRGHQGRPTGEGILRARARDLGQALSMSVDHGAPLELAGQRAASAAGRTRVQVTDCRSGRIVQSVPQEPITPNLQIARIDALVDRLEAAAELSCTGRR